MTPPLSERLRAWPASNADNERERREAASALDAQAKLLEEAGKALEQIAVRSPTGQNSNWGESEADCRRWINELARSTLAKLKAPL